MYSYYQSANNDNGTGGSGKLTGGHTFEDDQTCLSCHVQEWKGSHHEYAIEEADKKSVRGNFNNVAFREGNDIYRFFLDNNLYMVNTPGPEGKPIIYVIIYTFG